MCGAFRIFKHFLLRPHTGIFVFSRYCVITSFNLESSSFPTIDIKAHRLGVNTLTNWELASWQKAMNENKQIFFRLSAVTRGIPEVTMLRPFTIYSSDLAGGTRLICQWSRGWATWVPEDGRAAENKGGSGVREPPWGLGEEQRRHGRDCRGGGQEENNGGPDVWYFVILSASFVWRLFTYLGYAKQRISLWFVTCVNKISFIHSSLGKIVASLHHQVIASTVTQGSS